MYETPKVSKLGTLRSLTQFGYGQANDLLGIWLNNITNGTVAGPADGCTQNGGVWTGCRGS